MTQSFQMLLMAQTDDPNHFTRKLGYLSSICWIEASALSMGMKFLTGRSRPQYAANAQDWFHLGHSDTFGRFTAFPSSHATIYFSISTIWGKMLQDEFLGDLLGGANFLIMEGEHNHYVSDMVMGYLLGKAIGNYVWAQHAQDDLTSAWVIYPIYLTKDDTYFGCGLLRQF